MRGYLFIWFLIFSFGCNAQTKDGFVPVDGFQLYYKIYGNKGKPILLINGGPGFSSNYLDELAKTMSKDMNRTIILFDPRGTGQSIVKPISKRTINLRNQVSDIEDLRNHLAIKKWDIIGHAYGGAIAMLYADKYPESVHKVVLSSSIGVNLDFVDPMLANLKVRLSLLQSEELDELNQQRVKGKLSNAKFYKQRFDLLTEAYVFNRANIETAKNMITLETDFNLDVNQLLWDQMKREDYNIEKKMKKLNKQVLILHGRQDVIGESVPIYTHSLFSNSQLIFFNEAGRYLWLDQPAHYFKALEDFLN